MISLLNSMVTIKAQVPDNAATAGVLGTLREGVGVRISKDGLICTIGYLCLEATGIWVTSSSGQTAPAYIVAQDFESGLTLLLPGTDLGNSYLEPADLTGIQKGQNLSVLNDIEGPPFPCRLLSISEFAGRWEYLIDDALYTLPACDNWGGAALLNEDNQLIGIGSLFLQFPGEGDQAVYGNMFVPIQLIIPHLDEMRRTGHRGQPPRPWLGMMVDEVAHDLVVMGVYPSGPADRAGIKPEDRVVTLAGAPLRTLSGFLRTLWSLGEAGADIRLLLDRQGEVFEAVVESTDRSTFFSETSPRGLN